MAILSITEYANAAVDARGRGISAPMEPAVAYQDVVIAGVSDDSAALNVRTNFVFIHTDVECFIAVGTAPTANKTAASRTTMLGAGESIFLGVPVARSFIVAVIDNA